jgi:hypothetical protein
MKKFLLNLTLACFGLAASTNAQPFTQDFESVTTPALPTSWVDAHTGGGHGWETITGPVDWTLGTIPSHTKYCIVDNLHFRHNNPATLTGPTFSLVGVTNPYLSYDYFYFQAWMSASPFTHELAYINISTDGGTTYSLLDTIRYSPGGAWGTKFISLASYASASNCKLQFYYTDSGANLIGVALDNISVFSAVPNDIAITDISPKATAINDYVLTGSTATFTGSVLNRGTSPISSYTVTYQPGAGAPVTSTVSGTIAPFSTGTFTATTPYTVPTGSTPVKVWLTLGGDVNQTNDSMTTGIIGVAAFPPKKIAMEEATGTWCGFCVRGIIYMDSVWKKYPNDVSVVSIHNSDPMASENASTTAYDNLMNGMISGYPAMVIDRRLTTDPQNCLTAHDQLYGNVFGFATLGLTPIWGASTVTASVTCTPAVDLAGDFRLEMVITEELVHGTTAGWEQHNYYGIGGGSNGTPMKGCGYSFNDSLTTIPGSSMYYPFVARITVPADVNATNGVAGSLPATMTAGTPYTYSFAPVTIPSTWKKQNLRVVVYLVDNTSTNLTYRQILNSANSGLTLKEASVGVSNLTAGVEDMKIYPNPASDEAHVSFQLKNAGNVQFSIFDAAGREAFTHAAERMNAGGHEINISVADLASGVYNVVITTDNGTITQRLSVVK